jgi:hypothetical protein
LAKIFGETGGNVSVTLTTWSQVLRKYFEFEGACFEMRQVSQTKREHGAFVVNEWL